MASGRDAESIADGARVAHPAFHVLFVCTGNICRSPIAEGLLRLRLPVGFEVASAGTHAIVGAAMSPDALAELEARGGSAEGFRARQLTERLVQHSDLVLAATRALRSQVLAESPSALHRTFTITEFADLLDRVDGAGTLDSLVAEAAAARSHARPDELDIPDPWQRGPQVYAAAARMIDTALERIAKGLDR